MNYFDLYEEIEFLNERYVVISLTQYKDEDYAFASHLIGATDEPDNNFQIFTFKNGKIKIIEDIDLVNELIPIFTKKLNNLKEKGE